MTPQTSSHRSTKIASALRLACCAAIAVSLLAQSLSVSYPSLAITAGTSETFTANMPANWSLSGQGTLSPTVNTTASVYTAPGAVTVNQTSTITATAGANSISNTVTLLPPSPVVSPLSGTYNVGPQPVMFTLSGSQGDNWTGNNGNELLILDISPTTNYQWNNTCNLQYRPSLQGGTVFLVTDSGNQPYPSGIIGHSQVVSNSQCSVDLVGATQTWNGPNVTVHLPITFTATYTGPKTIFAQAYPDTNDMCFAVGGINLVTGSQPSISVAPATASLTAGQNQQFTATVNNLSNNSVNWTLNPQLGTISSAGLYTAPSPVTGPQSVTVTATSQVNSGVSGTAAITLSGGIATDLNIPATTLTSGTTSYQATHNITATSGFTMSGNAGATFLAGNQIDIGPGFRAAEGTTFKADIGSGTGLMQTITTAPITGLQLTVGGQPCTSPCTVLWTPGQTYNISLTSPQFQSADIQFVFSNWSDGGAQSHAVTAPSSPATYTASFATQYSLTTSVAPPDWGTVTPSGWYNSGDTASVTATPAAGYSFANFTGDVGGSSNPMNVPMTGPKNVVANFTSAPMVQQQITTSPVTGLQLTVGGQACTSPCTTSMQPGQSYQISAVSPQVLGGSQYVFLSWSDGGGQTHTVTAGSVPGAIWANFVVSGVLTITSASLPSGSVQVAYSQALSATGGTAPYTWAMASGTLPAGLGLSTTGVLSGVPIVAGAYNFNIRVTDNAGQIANAGLNLSVSSSMNLTDMAVSSLFVDRHEWMVSAGGSMADEALNDILPQTDVAIVNSITAPIKQQLDQLQAQALSYSESDYLALRRGILQNLQSQLQSQLSASSSGAISAFIQGGLRPQMSAADLATTAPCIPTSSLSCIYLYSEINFYRDVTNANARGLGGYVKSWVEGGDAAHYCSTVKDWKGTFTPANGEKKVYSSGNNTNTVCNGGAAFIGFTEPNPGRGTYKVEAHHEFTFTHKNSNGGTVVDVITSFPSLYLGISPPWPATRTLQSDGYDKYETPVDFGLQVTATPELGKPGHHLITKNCAAPVSVQVVFTPPLPPPVPPATVTPAPPITWTGGTAGADNLHRQVPCTSPGDVTVRAAMGTNLYADVTVHVVDAVPPGPLGQANITQNYLGYIDPGVNFGYFLNGIDAAGAATPPSYFPSVTAGLDGDHWVFRLGSIVDGYKTGAHSLGRTDLPQGNLRPFPIADRLVAAEGAVTVVRAHAAARDDLNTSEVVPNKAVVGGPPLQYYYVANIIEAHEQKHVEHFYLPALAPGAGWYYQNMLSFERDIVENPVVSSVNYSCEPAIRPGENTGSGAKSLRRLTTWDDALDQLYKGADRTDLLDTEDYAYRSTNPQFDLIRNQIPTGGAPQLNEATMSPHTATPGTLQMINIDGTNLDAHPVASIVPDDPKVSVFYDSGTPTHITLRVLVAPDAPLGARTIKVETDNGFSTVTLTIVSTP